MQIEILTAEGCGSHGPTVDLVRKIMARSGAGFSIEERVIQTDAQAKEHLFLGSPSIRINGVDIDLASHDRSDYGLG